MRAQREREVHGGDGAGQVAAGAAHDLYSAVLKDGKAAAGPDLH